MPGAPCERCPHEQGFPALSLPSATRALPLGRETMVSLIIYNMEGAVVSTLVEEYQKADYHNISWGGTNNSGNDVSSGRYILKMSTPRFTDSITMTLLK